MRGRSITMTKLCDRSDSVDRVRKYTPGRVPCRPVKNHVITWLKWRLCVPSVTNRGIVKRTRIARFLDKPTSYVYSRKLNSGFKPEISKSLIEITRHSKIYYLRFNMFILIHILYARIYDEYKNDLLLWV